MDFTREPIIETIVTPKEGCKLVVRSSKSTGQEEYFVDAVEIASFGHALFFRSLERPKAFLVPVSDYEILEVKEARMVLKNAGLDRSIKIGGGRDGTLKASREAERVENLVLEEEIEESKIEADEASTSSIEAAEARPEMRVDKKRDRRRHYRKRRGKEEREEAVKEEATELSVPPLEDEKISISPPEHMTEEGQEQPAPISSTVFSSLLQPPPTLISETINRYRQNDLFKSAFYLTEEEQYKPHDKVQELLNEEDEEEMVPALQEPTFSPDANLDLFSVLPSKRTVSEVGEEQDLFSSQDQNWSQEERSSEPETSSFEEEIPSEQMESVVLEQTRDEVPLMHSEGREESQPKQSANEEEKTSESALPLFAEEERTVEEEEVKPSEEAVAVDYQEPSKEEPHHPENAP